LRSDDLTLAMQAHDFRWTIERAEHEHDAPVLTKVGNRLDAAPIVIDVADPSRTEHAKCLETLRRQVHMPVSSCWRGSNEKHTLGAKEFRNLFVNLLIEFTHAAILPACGPRPWSFASFAPPSL
jgi:hypothetical protein